MMKAQSNLEMVKDMMDRKRKHEMKSKGETADDFFSYMEWNDYTYDTSLPIQVVRYWVNELDIDPSRSWADFSFHFVYLYSNDMEGFRLGGLFPITDKGIEMYEKILEMMEAM